MIPFLFLRPARLWPWVLAGLAAALRAQPVMPPAHVTFPPPLSPAESLAALQVPAGMTVELVAAEPAVLDPIDVAWGADGRMWVVEMADYPLGLDDQGAIGGRVRVLESTRGDGRYDKSTLFAEGLRYPTSAVPWRNGVLVTAAPDILLLEDTDGDGRADRTTKLFTSLGEGNQQHMANALQWGLDGWLHVANGGTRGAIVSVKTGEKLEMGRDVRIRPDEGLAQALTGRSQYGRNRDDWGNWFGNNNTHPVWHYALEDHYLRRNPHLRPPNAIVEVPEIPGAAPVYPVSETLARFNSPQGFNHITSACSPLIYRDELLGAEYAGNVFVCEPVHNLVHREIVTPRGTTFSSRRAPGEQSSEFLASTDNWARFCSVRAGPDGALYVIDMYRLIIEHPQYIPGEWMRRLPNLRAGSEQGRIYRVFPRGTPLRPVPRLDRADTAGLVAAHESVSGPVRDRAQEQLVWRHDTAAAPGLDRLLRQARRPQTRVQALCSLDLLGVLTPAQVAAALVDPHPGVRRQAVRLSEQFAQKNPELLPAVIRLAEDADAMVRQQVAYTLGEWPGAMAGAALVKLSRESEDRFVVAAALSSALPHAGTLIARLDLASGVDRTLLEIAIASRDSGLQLQLLQRLGAPLPPGAAAAQFTVLGQFLDGLARHRSSLAQLTDAGDDAMKGAVRRVRAIVAHARERAAAAGAPLAERVAAVALLGREPAAQAEDLKLLTGLVTSRHPVELQLAAVAATKNVGLATVPSRLLEGWAGHGPQVRAAVLDLLTSRPRWAQLLLDHIEAHPAMLPQIDTAHRTALSRHQDKAVAERATRVLQAGFAPDRQKMIDDYIAATASLPGDAGRGALVFQNTCASCHRFGEVAGGAIGPDLAGNSDRSAAYLITHVLDPNRVVESRYELYTATRSDGTLLAGMLAAESGNSLTLVGLDGVELVVLRGDLQTLVSTGRSLMPEGLEAAIPPGGMADLVNFLATPGGATRPQP